MNNLDTAVHNKQTQAAADWLTDPRSCWHSGLIERRDNIERLPTSDEKFMIFVCAQRRCFVMAGVPVTVRVERVRSSFHVHAARRVALLSSPLPACNEIGGGGGGGPWRTSCPAKSRWITVGEAPWLPHWPPALHRVAWIFQWRVETICSRMQPTTSPTNVGRHYVTRLYTALQPSVW